jgi:hypothetical protein
MTSSGKAFVFNYPSPLKRKTMRRALFIAVIALTALSCNNSGENSGSSDTTRMDTMTNMNNNAGSSGNMSTDTSTMNRSNMGRGTDTAGRTSRDTTRRH